MPFDVLQQGFDRFVDPFGVQMQLDFLPAFAYQSDNFFQRLAAESRREQGLDEENPFQPVFAEYLHGVGQPEIAACRLAIDIPPEGVREFFVEVVPTVAPDLDIDRKEDVKHSKRPL